MKNIIKFKGSVLTQTKVINNLLRFYDLANDSEKIEGNEWYGDANNFAQSLSDQYNIPIHAVCGIIAALSPQQSWQLNKVIAKRFCSGEREGLHYSAQIAKAVKCLTSTEVEIYNFMSKGQIKTSQFYYNILHPNYKYGATIDRHAILACIGRPKLGITLDFDVSMTANQYRFFESCYIEAANKLDVLPHVFQAIVWVVVRRLKELPKEYIIQAPF